MEIKPLLKRYIQFYKLYEKAKDESELKTLILNDDTIDKDMVFYDLVREDGSGLNGAFFSYGEAIACQAYLSRQRYTNRWSNPTLKEENRFTIIEISLSMILKEQERLSGLFSRMKHINPYNEDDINNEMPEHYEVKVLWDFGHHFEPRYIYHDGKDFISSTHKDAKLPWSIDNGYTTMIDDEGNYGVVYNAGGYHDIKLEIVLEFEYFFADGNDSENNGLVSVQKQKKQTDNYKEFTCEIIDLKTKEVYSKSALTTSLDGDNFIIVDQNRYMQYVKIDTKDRKIEAVSKKYKTILNPIHYAPKPVQDRDTHLWGYIDNRCQELISPKFKNFGSFNSSYAIIKEDDKEFVIDLKGDVIIEPKDEIIHYDELFFIRVDKKWAVYKGSKIYIDFIDTQKKIEKLKKEKNLKDEELFEYLKKSYCTQTGYMWLNANTPEEILLRFAIVGKKRELHKRMHQLPLKEYIKLYDTFTTDKDLREAGLWGKKVKIKDAKVGNIGWNYPASASLYDMSKELPVDGFGVALEELELLKDD